MATLTIRDVADDLKAALRVQAAQNGRSMEAEVRAILEREVLREPNQLDLGQRIHARFRGLGDVVLDLPARTALPRAVEFDP